MAATLIPRRAAVFVSAANSKAQAMQRERAAWLHKNFHITLPEARDSPRRFRQALEVAWAVRSMPQSRRKKAA